MVLVFRQNFIGADDSRLPAIGNAEGPSYLVIGFYASII